MHKLISSIQTFHNVYIFQNIMLYMINTYNKKKNRRKKTLKINELTLRYLWESRKKEQFESKTPSKQKKKKITVRVKINKQGKRVRECNKKRV